mgnify:CR=1 FL=1|jgi:hypothetical protein
MPTSRPRASDPVKLRRSTRLSLTSASPVSPPPHTNAASPASSLFASRTDWTILVVAMAVSGVVGAGFQTVALPVTNESEKFQPNTAFGKLKAVICICHRSVCSTRMSMVRQLFLPIRNGSARRSRVNSTVATYNSDNSERVGDLHHLVTCTSSRGECSPDWDSGNLAGSRAEQN